MCTGHRPRADLYAQCYSPATRLRGFLVRRCLVLLPIQKTTYTHCDGVLDVHRLQRIYGGSR